MSEEIIETVYSARHSKSPTFSYCGRFIFFLREFGQESCLMVTNLGGIKYRIEIDSSHSDNVIEIYSSHLTNHIALLTQEGDEKAQIHVFIWKKDDDLFKFELKHSTEELDGNKKHLWGGFDYNDFVFFRLEQSNNPDSWNLLKWVYDEKTPSLKNNAGYYPEMIGKSKEKWVWRNQITTTKSMLNGKGDVIQARIGMCRSSDDEKLYAIIDYEDATVGQISRISIDQDAEAPILHTNAEFVSQDWIASNLPSDDNGDIPLGELQNFIFVKEKKILFHMNENGTSKLLLADVDSLDSLQLIDIKKVEEAFGGKVWINVMKSSPDKKIVVLEVMNYNVSTHLWLYFVEENVLKQLIDTADEFEIMTMSSTFTTSLDKYDQISMQYLKVDHYNKEYSKGTVILFHGGPALQTHVGRYFTRVVTLAKAGYTVILPNPAGSLGRGGKHINLDRGRDRIHQFDAQIIPFVSEITKHGPVHLYGGSYAGWLITRILNHEVGSNIESAVIRNGIVDWKIFTDKTSIFRKRHRSWEYVGKDSFESESATEILDHLSPGHELKCSKILFFTGEKDIRVPSDSTREFLQECGFSESDIDNIHTEYEDEGHKIKKYEHKIEIMTKTLELFLNE